MFGYFRWSDWIPRSTAFVHLIFSWFTSVLANSSFALLLCDTLKHIAASAWEFPNGYLLTCGGQVVYACSTPKGPVVWIAEESASGGKWQSSAALSLPHLTLWDMQFCITPRLNITFAGRVFCVPWRLQSVSLPLHSCFSHVIKSHLRDVG